VPGLSAHRIVLQLTEEQRKHIRQRTGLDTTLLGFEPRVPVLRCRFAGLLLEINRGVFPPQAASEPMVYCALRAAAAEHQPILVDVGTGCGAMALALAAARPDAVIYATDVSQRALRCARHNRRRLDNAGVRFRSGSLLDPIPARVRGHVAVVLGNVPYVPKAAHSRDDWPVGTAYGEGDDGLGLVRQFAAQARDVLRPGGTLVFQLAGGQWQSFAAELIALGYAAPDVVTYNGSGRACVGLATWQSEQRSRFNP